MSHNCAKRSPSLIISAEDIQYFNAIIERAGEEVQFFPSYDNTQLAATIIHPQARVKGVVLLIHGLCARANLYLPLADELAENGYRIYLLDIRGHGYSQGVSGQMPSRDAMARDIRYFYDFVFNLEGSQQHYIAIGHSLGTYVWINFLSTYEDAAIDALALISGGSTNKFAGNISIKEKMKYLKYINKWKAFCSFFNHNMKPVHIVFKDIPQLAQSGFIQDYGFSFFSFFRKSEKRFEDFYKNTKIPIMMKYGSEDELFDTANLEETYQLIGNENKKLVSLNGKTHTSIIWSSASYINNWLEDYFDTIKTPHTF